MNVVFRWNMTILKDKTASDKTEPEAVEESTLRPPLAQITRPREVCYFGPVSVAPNTTYIRRLEHKGLLMPESKGCTLPSLAAKDNSHAKANGKRKRIDLPSVDR